MSDALDSGASTIKIRATANILLIICYFVCFCLMHTQNFNFVDKLYQSVGENVQFKQFLHNQVHLKFTGDFDRDASVPLFVSPTVT